MSVAFPPSSFWDFSLRLYASPGVADACLRLQARHGIDVNLLFCCLWRGAEGQRLSRREIAAMVARVKTLHEQVVKPLRTARTTLKSMVDGEASLAGAILGVRAAVKKSELDAEHVEQLVLAGMFALQSGIIAAEIGGDAAQANIESYCAALGLRLSAADRADLALLAGSSMPAKIEPSHAVAPPVRKAEHRGRRGPLARDRGGA